MSSVKAKSREMAGKTCVITGATSGLGKATALTLGQMGAHLILIGRNQRFGEAVADRIRSESPEARIEFIRTDLSVQKDVRALASRIANDHRSLDVLINNAGARFDTYQESGDGIELTFATNHLSHFLLTCLLLDRLRAAPNARVVTVASGSHSGVSADGDWCLRSDNFDRRTAYGKSKLANLMFAYELADRLGGTDVTSNAMDPGGVASNFARNNGMLSWVRHLVAHGIKRELVSPEKGAETIVYLAASPEIAGRSGKYFFRKQEIDSSPASRNREAGRQLWALSSRLTGLGEEASARPPLIRA
jgi:NAD(P)-dependent dehydrogenase (short-subunit alcohol dehydrogenase family)